jgi:hypothetical protein
VGWAPDPADGQGPFSAASPARAHGGAFWRRTMWKPSTPHGFGSGRRRCRRRRSTAAGRSVVRRSRSRRSQITVTPSHGLAVSRP